MDEWAVALILIGVSVMVTAGLIGMCRMLGGWTYLYALATGNKEERTQLASHEELGNNGYIVSYNFRLKFYEDVWYLELRKCLNYLQENLCTNISHNGSSKINYQ